MTEENTLYVGVPSSTDIRREALESSQTLLNILKRSELFREVKQLKNSYVKELTKTLDEINSLQRKLKNKMPKSPTQKTETTLEPAKPETIKSQIEILEEELAKIEAALKH